MEDWQVDKARADAYWPDVEQIIRDNVGKIAHVHPAPAYEDAKLNRDYVVDTVKVACRLRWEESTRGLRDITFRCRRKRPDGSMNIYVDLHKIRRGYVRWYLYGWIDEQGRLREWVIVDCFQALAYKLFDNHTEIPNTDGKTWFIAVPVEEFCRVGGIENGVLNETYVTEHGISHI